MNKSELIDRIADRTGETKKSVGDVIDSMFEVIGDTVSKGGDKITIQGQLSFERVNTKERKGHNPQTNQPIIIPAGTKTKVTVLSKLKEAGKK